jgi:hypothetical protein
MGMSKQDWRGIMEIAEIQHVRNGEVIWEAKNIKNLLHYDGEEFLLRAAFTGGQNSDIIPENYYLGLDNRGTILADDSMLSITGEPITHGYSRQAVSSAGDFTVSNDDNSHFRAISPIVAFRAIGGSWGPIQTLFLTDRSNNSGYLISTAALTSPISVAENDAITLRISMKLRDCPTS